MPVTDRQTGAIHYHFRLLGTLWMVILACLHPRNCLSQSRINELQIAPASSGLEFVEVILIGSEPLDLSKLTLEDSRKKPGQLVFPDGESRILNPGEIVVLAQNPELLQNVFGKMHVVGVKPWPALNNGGDSIALRAGSTLLDSFAYVWNELTRTYLPQFSGTGRLPPPRAVRLRVAAIRYMNATQRLSLSVLQNIPPIQQLTSISQNL